MTNALNRIRPADAAETGYNDRATIRLFGLLISIRRRLAASRRRRHAIRQLSSMPDRTLQDLGIPRDRIADVVDGLLVGDAPDARSVRAAPTHRSAGREPACAAC